MMAANLNRSTNTYMHPIMDIEATLGIDLFRKEEKFQKQVELRTVSPQKMKIFTSAFRILRHNWFTANLL